MAAIDWPALMRLGLVELRLSPEVFWGLTPAELTFLATGGAGVAGRMDRSALQALMARFPDQGEDDGGI